MQQQAARLIASACAIENGVFSLTAYIYKHTHTHKHAHTHTHTHTQTCLVVAEEVGVGRVVV